MNTSIPRKHSIVLALSIILAIASYWIPLPRESHDPHTGISSAEKPVFVNSKSFLATH